MPTCKDCIHYDICIFHLKGDENENCVQFMNTADVVPRSEVNELEYTLSGVMHFVDKWLEGDELKQDEVNRAITMREKTLRIVENANREGEWEKRVWVVFDSEIVGYHCSECNTTWDTPTPFCPNCGAKMRNRE